MDTVSAHSSRIPIVDSSERMKLHQTLFKTLGVLLLGICLAGQTIVAVAAANPNAGQQCPKSDSETDATHWIRSGQDVVWQIPPNPKSILFLAHGGYKNPFMYFDQGPNCQLCYGLPENRRIVLEALGKGYAVISIKSLGVGYDPWKMAEGEDLAIATSVMREWTREYSLEGLPMAAWGHSAGGLFASVLPLTLPIKALVLMCDEGLPRAEDEITPFPPTFFVVMPEDTSDMNIFERVRKQKAFLEGRGVPVMEKFIWPKPISPLYFTQRIPCMSEEMSEGIYWAFRDAGWLDGDDYLIKSPNTDDWESVLWEAKVLPVVEGSEDLYLGQHVEQELEVAKAEHSMTSDANHWIFPWLDMNLRSSVEPLHRLSAPE